MEYFTCFFCLLNNFLFLEWGEWGKGESQLHLIKNCQGNNNEWNCVGGRGEEGGSSMISTKCDCYCILEGACQACSALLCFCFLLSWRQMKLQAGEIDFIYLAVNINTHTLTHTKGDRDWGSHNFCGCQSCHGCLTLFNMHERVCCDKGCKDSTYLLLPRSPSLPFSTSLSLPFSFTAVVVAF